MVLYVAEEKDIFILQPGGKLVIYAKAAIPTVGDQAAAMSLANASKSMAAALAELRAAATKAHEACGSLEVDGAIDQIHDMEKELLEIRSAAQSGRLLPLPGETVSLVYRKLTLYIYIGLLSVGVIGHHDLV